MQTSLSVQEQQALYDKVMIRSFAAAAIFGVFSLPFTFPYINKAMEKLPHSERRDNLARAKTVIPVACGVWAFLVLSGVIFF